MYVTFRNLLLAAVFVLPSAHVLGADGTIGPENLVTSVPSEMQSSVSVQISESVDPVDVPRAHSAINSIPMDLRGERTEQSRWVFGDDNIGSSLSNVRDHSILLAQADTAEDVNDPLEPLNRVIFQFNEVVYSVLLDPLARTYNAYVPDTLRSAIRNFLAHISSPVTFVNDLLQLEFERAMVTLGRFVVNTTAGMGGVADVAETIGLESHEEDFGQTLGAHGVGEGFYLVLPLFGPSNPRDAVGRFVVDPYFDPLGLWLENTDRDAESYSRIGMTVLTQYADVVDELDQVRKTSVDYYAAMRSLYRQRRASLISNGEDAGIPDIPNYDLNSFPSIDDSIAKSQ